MKSNYINRLCLASLLVLVFSCKPEQVGFLNEHMRYNVSEIQVVQGTSVSTPPLIANGSSTPMEVRLLEVRNKATGAPVPEFLTPSEFPIYLGQIGVDDVTLEQLQAKIGTNTLPAISVNEIGGKVTFSPATMNIAPGVYTIDLEVSNISGSKVIKQALDVNIIAMRADSVFASGANVSKLGADNTVSSFQGLEVKVEHIDNGKNEIIYMWVDKNGKPFNPAQGEVVRRANAPSFADWSPYYPEKLTDTAIVYPYPFYQGLVYPMKTTARVGETNFTDLASNYRVTYNNNSIWRNINTSATIRYYKSGTHIVRFKLNGIERGTPKLTTITRDVVLPEGDGYNATVVSLDKAELGNALGLPPEEIAGLLGSKITYYAIEPGGVLNPNSTAAAPGHWFDGNGKVLNWGDNARLYSEFKINDFAFYIGQFPDRNFAGNTFTLKQSFVHEAATGVHQVIYVFNIKVQ